MLKKISTNFIDNIMPFEEPSRVAEEDVFSVEKAILNFKSVCIASIFILTINCLINFFFDYSYSFYITCLACLFNVFVYIVVNRNNLPLIRMCLVVADCITICLLCYIEGLVVGNYLFLFVLLVISIFIFSYSERKYLIAVFLLIIVSFIFIFSFAPIHSSFQKISATEERNTFTLNLLFSLIVLCILSYLALRQHHIQAQFISKERQFLNTIYNTSLDGVFIVDVATMYIQDCNTQSITLFGVNTKQEILNKPAATFFKNFSSAMYNPGESWQGNLTCLTANATEFPGYISIVPFLHGNKMLKKINILNISDIKKVEEELIEAKNKAELAMKAKSTFLGNMSHELRTPLNGIIGTINLLLEEKKLPDQQEHFNLLKYSGDHMLHLINEILDFSKIEAEKVVLEQTSFNVAKFMQKVKSLFTNQFALKGIALHFEVDEKLNIPFIGDETRLNQVLVNLISNALKFTDKGGVIVVAKRIEAKKDKAKILFSVKDSGIGIGEEQQKIIFESFTQGDASTTRRFGGTGLGLSISKEIVEIFKSKLFVESKNGEGSKFYFTVELEMNRTPLQIEVVEDTSNRNLRSMKILVAEDNNINMLVIRKFLTKWNATIVEAKDGVEALEKFENDKFDLLLIDLEMPRLDGYQTIKQIREKNKHIPAIAFTAAIYENIQTDLMQHGFTAYVQKPFKAEDLYNKLTENKK